MLLFLKTHFEYIEKDQRKRTTTYNGYALLIFVQYFF